MTLRDEILAAVPAVLIRAHADDFSPQDVVDELRSRGSAYRPSSIRTHVTSRMCVDAPDHHARTYDDFERAGRGRYRLRRR